MTTNKLKSGMKVLGSTKIDQLEKRKVYYWGMDQDLTDNEKEFIKALLINKFDINIVGWDYTIAQESKVQDEELHEKMKYFHSEGLYDHQQPREDEIIILDDELPSKYFMHFDMEDYTFIFHKKEMELHHVKTDDLYKRDHTSNKEYYFFTRMYSSSRCEYMDEQ